MAASLNRVFLMGNLTRDPELRYVPSGTAVANFSIAVNRVYLTQTGDKKEETAFVRIVVWGRRAEVSAEYLTKGSPVFIEGRLSSRSWETQDGQKRNTLEVIAANVQFLNRSPKQKNTLPPGQGGGIPGDVPRKEVASIDLNSATQESGSGEVPF